MKTLLTLLMLTAALMAAAQGDPRPANLTGFKPVIPNPMFYVNRVDTSYWVNNGPVDGWKKFAGYFKTQYKIDSIRNDMYSKMYEVEVSTEGQTSYTLPFTLRSKTMVYYNGILLRSSQWFGVGTTYITIGVETKIKDYIKIQN